MCEGGGGGRGIPDLLICYSLATKLRTSCLPSFVNNSTCGPQVSLSNTVFFCYSKVETRAVRKLVGNGGKLIATH